MCHAWVSVSDFFSAKISISSGANALLVGDSLAMTVYGYSDTHQMTREIMRAHGRAVLRAAEKSIPVIMDLPIGTYATPKKAAESLHFFSEFSFFKMEGGREILPQFRLLTKKGASLVGHLGLLPQSSNNFSTRGKTAKEAEKIFEDALLLEEAGAWALLLESVPESLGKKITEKLSIPVIGIGAGRYCNGQILVYSDIVGRQTGNVSPKFLRTFGRAQQNESRALSNFVTAVRESSFPSETEVYF